MSRPIESYLVLKVLQADRDNFNKYVCVLNSWITHDNYHENCLIAHYPDEDDITTSLRLLEQHPLDDQWPLVQGEIVFETECHAEAMRHMKERNEKEANEEWTIIDDTIENEKMLNAAESSVVEKSPITDKHKKCSEKHQLNLFNFKKRKLVQDVARLNEILENQMFDVLKEIRGKLDKYKRAKTTRHDAEIQTDDVLPNNEEYYQEDKAKENTEVSKQRPKRKVANQTIPASFFIDSSDEYEELGENDPDFEFQMDVSNRNVTSKRRVLKKSYGQETIRPRSKIIYKQPESVPLNSDIKKDGNSKTQTPIADATVVANKEIYKSIQSLLSYCMQTESNPALSSMAYNLEVLLNQSNGNITQETEAVTPKPVTNVKATDTIRNSSTESLRCNNRSDPENLWTLRYRKFEPGLVELLPNTGIYVNEDNLHNILHRSFNNARRLAVYLMIEVFNDEALKTCALACRGTVRNDKPRLNMNGQDTILTYVCNHCEKENWVKVDVHLIFVAMKNKLFRNRRQIH